MKSELVEEECTCLLWEVLGRPEASEPEEKVGRALEEKRVDWSGLRDKSMLSTTE